MAETAETAAMAATVVEAVVAAAVATAAVMAAVTAAPTWRQHGRGGVRCGRWAEVIFRTYYYLHNRTYRCDNNCQAYGKTLKCFVSKHFSVLFGKTRMCFAKHLSVFNLLSPFVEYTFGRTLILSKMCVGFPNMGDFRKTFCLVRVQYCPPFFPVSSCYSWIYIKEDYRTILVST
jgi:hypothetical protein